MDTLNKFGQWFVAGFGLALGALSVVLIALVVARSDEPRFADKHVDRPRQIKVTDVQPVAFTDFLAVTGSLTNSGAGKYSSSYLQLALTRNGKVIFTCGDVDSTVIEPGHSARFQVLCT